MHCPLVANWKTRWSICALCLSIFVAIIYLLSHVNVYVPISIFLSLFTLPFTHLSFPSKLERCFISYFKVCSLTFYLMSPLSFYTKLTHHWLISELISSILKTPSLYFYFFDNKCLNISVFLFKNFRFEDCSNKQNRCLLSYFIWNLLLEVARFIFIPVARLKKRSL